MFFLMSAGYPGSLLIGVLLFLVAVRSHADRVLMDLLGAVMLLVAALFVREWFALAFTVGTGLVMLASARYMPHDVNDMALRVIGLCLRYGLGRHSNITGYRSS